MEIIDRITAKSLGLKRYFTGTPCLRGHLSERFVSTSGCVNCVNPSSKPAVIKDDAYILAEFAYISAISEASAKLKIAQAEYDRSIAEASMSFAIAKAASAESSKKAFEAAALTVRHEAERAKLEREKAFSRMAVTEIEVFGLDIERFDDLVLTRSRERYPALKFSDVVLGVGIKRGTARRYRLFVEDTDAVRRLSRDILSNGVPYELR